MNFSTLTGSKNKPRIFLGYYSRPAIPGDEPYDVALLVRSHPLDRQSVSSMKLHVVSRAQPPTAENPEGRQAWMFEARATKFVTDDLAGVLYLGKLPKGKSIDDLTEICSSVPVAPAGEEEWRGRHWVWDAIQRLEEAEIILPLPCNGEELHRRGRNYILGRKRENQHDFVTINTQMEPYDFSI